MIATAVAITAWVIQACIDRILVDAFSPFTKSHPSAWPGWTWILPPAASLLTFLQRWRPTLNLTLQGQTIMTFWLFPAVLGFFLIFAVWLRSFADTPEWLWAAGMAGIGWLLACVPRFAAFHFGHLFFSTKTITRGFLGSLLIFYIVGYWLIYPDGSVPAIPPLVFILALMCIFCWLYSELSSYLDALRIPIVLTAFAVVNVLYIFFNRDYTYTTTATNVIHPLTVAEAFQARAETFDKTGVFTVVTVSGGGISAARWGTEVMTRLQMETNGQWGNSVALISAVSGGGVGALYFVDTYQDGQSPPLNNLTAVNARAETSSLSATAWGILYRDILRFLPIFDQHQGRGWALEQNWDKRLANPGVSLSHWQQGVQAGWLPITIFNTTTSESGERFLISPVSFHSESKRRQPLNFVDVYKNRDIKMATAARLSATFPYVSPIARPDLSNAGSIPEKSAYHLADGGYYDNHGIASALTYLDSVLPLISKHETPLTVLLVQIRLGDLVRQEADVNSAWKQQLFGPITTLANVRTASQIERNDAELARLITLWTQKHGLVFVNTVFSFGDEYSLSWHLSTSEKQRFAAQWSDSESQAASGNQQALKDVKQLFTDRTTSDSRMEQ